MFIMMPLTTFLILLFIYMIYRSFVEDNRLHHQAQMQAQFFCCPQCNAKYMPKNMIVGEDKKFTEMLMVCKKCSSKGVFKIKSFHLLCCNICNNKIESPDGSRWWHTEKALTTIHQLNPSLIINASIVTPLILHLIFQTCHQVIKE